MKTDKHSNLTVIFFALFIATFASTAALANDGANKPVNFNGSYRRGEFVNDKTKPVQGRSYFTPEVVATPNGFELALEMWHGKLDASVSVGLELAINDGKGGLEAVDFLVLDDKKADNKKLYYSKRKYKLTYEELNAALRKAYPNLPAHIVIGPGTPLFAKAVWHDYYHMWGSIDRGGIFIAPGKAQANLGGGNQRRTLDLDLAYGITETMRNKYNNLEKKTGLASNGQIRSRLEAEGKYQLSLDQLPVIKKQLFEMVDDPKLAQRVLGKEWTISAELRYMKRDEKKELILDKDGLPTPDPMQDTYYDNDTYEAAKNDTVLRYRFTEGNQTGSWNIKPGAIQVSPEGVAYRIEYGVDATDNQPSSIRKFADSADALNPFQSIQNIAGGKSVTEFLKEPAVKVIDTRFKFKLTNQETGLVVEMSLDDFIVKDLRNAKNRDVRIAQLEMDIEHLATKTSNVAGNASYASYFSYQVSAGAQQQFVAKLNEDSFVDGRAIMHTLADLDPASPIREKNNADFESAEKVIKRIRGHLIGDDWVAGAQKYAVAAERLKLVTPAQASASVKAMKERIRAIRQKGGRYQLSRVVADDCAVALTNE